MSYGKIEDHQVDVELEIRGRPDALEHRRRRHQFEVDKLSVTIFWQEVRRHFEIKDKQHIVAYAKRGLHPVRDCTRRNSLAHQARRDRGLFLALFQQGVADPVLVADAAGNEVVELIRSHLLGWGSAPDPQAQGFALPKIGVEMHAIGARTEEGDGAAVEAKDRWRTPV